MGYFRKHSREHATVKLRGSNASPLGKLLQDFGICDVIPYSHIRRAIVADQDSGSLECRQRKYADMVDYIYFLDLYSPIHMNNSQGQRSELLAAWHTEAMTDMAKYVAKAKLFDVSRNIRTLFYLAFHTQGMRAAGRG